MLAFEAGKAIINSWSRPFHHNGRDYYWDNNPNAMSNGIQCSITLQELYKLSNPSQQANAKRQANSTAMLSSSTPSIPAMTNDEILRNLQYRNGTRPQQITWICQREFEVCCGTDCCPSPSNEHSELRGVGLIIGITAALALAVCCCAGIGYLLRNQATADQRGIATTPDSAGFTPDPYDPNYGPPYLYPSYVHYTDDYDYQRQTYPQQYPYYERNWNYFPQEYPHAIYSR